MSIPHRYRIQVASNGLRISCGEAGLVLIWSKTLF